MASLETHWNRDAGYYAVPWRGTWAGESGGAILSHAIHAHDLLCRYFGPLAAVQAQLATRVNPIETEDCAALAFRFASGALGTSSVTLGSAKDESRLRFVFRDLTATSDTEPYAPAIGPWRFAARDPSRQAEVDEIVAAQSDARPGFVGYLEAVADHLAGRPSAAVTFEDGRASIELVTAIYDAARSGRAVELPLPDSHPLWSGWQPEDKA
jgi:predicted dehydrogenase